VLKTKATFNREAVLFGRESTGHVNFLLISNLQY